MQKSISRASSSHSEQKNVFKKEDVRKLADLFVRQQLAPKLVEALTQDIMKQAGDSKVLPNLC